MHSGNNESYLGPQGPLRARRGELHGRVDAHLGRSNLGLHTRAAAGGEPPARGRGRGAGGRAVLRRPPPSII